MGGFLAPLAPLAASLQTVAIPGQENGFAAPALITILALMIVGQGLIHTGVIEASVMPLVERFRLRPVATAAALFLAVVNSIDQRSAA